jgi:4-aminobutyrate aminotransferase-like enzyme
MKTRFADVKGALPGPRSRALVAREAGLLAPGIQTISTLAGIALDGGEGALVRDADGNTFLDFFAGVGVASIGHGHPALAAALAAQAAKLSATSFASEARARLLERIAAATAASGLPALRRTQLYSGGAEAVESALRLARAYTKKREIVGFTGAFHGKTGGVLGLMGSSWKDELGPFVPGQHLAPYPDRAIATHPALRAGAQAPALETRACLAQLEALLDDRARDVAAILVEPMQGTAGNVIPPADFLPQLAAIAHARGALLVADEMITGWGRTGRMFAVEHTRTTPDILVFGKGVAAGHPVSGLVTTDEIARAEPWSRPSFSSSSYGGSPLSCAAADAVIQVIVEQRLHENAARVGESLFGALAELPRKHRSVAEVRGRGLFLGLELVDDRERRTPMSKARCERLFHECLRRGLLAMVYTPRARINPPLVLSEAQALEGAAILDEALTALEAA